MTADVTRRASLIEDRAREASARSHRAHKQHSAALDDQARLTYLQALGVDFITLKDGRVIDVANNNNDLRGALDGMRFGDWT